VTAGAAHAHQLGQHLKALLVGRHARISERRERVLPQRLMKGGLVGIGLYAERDLGTRR